MSDSLRDMTLNAKNQPNALARYVHTALRDAECPIILKVGPETGARCGGKLMWNAANGQCGCSKTPWHMRQAHEEPYGAIIWSIINAVPKETVDAFTSQDSAEQVNATTENVINATANDIAKRLASQECTALGVEDTGEFHLRPDGQAPDGMLWSFRLGKWMAQ